ncbi:Ubx domain-containing protein [Vairimorpha necatrix]|uniref:Ubx domain-containing protein n=1 Tax=Vairimorpha necatrix TaxID=6039 RepID=A0AAX4JAX7_9MICR
MDQQSRIRKIMSMTNCSYDQALESDKESKGNLNLAIEMAKKKSTELYVGGGSSGLAVESSKKNEIVSYKNGLLVNNKFYDYSEDDNLRLKKMLENNEFDAGVLGVHDDKAEVIFRNCENEEYQKEEEIKPRTYEDNKKHVLSFDSNLEVSCPDEIVMDENGEVKFKFLVSGRRVSVFMNEKMKISDFYEELKKYTSKNVVLTKGDRKINPTDDVNILKRNMFILKEEK